MKTSVNNTVWEVKFYPYLKFYPATNNVEESLKEDTPYVLKRGITSISMSRSKDSPYGVANITVVGTPEKPFQKGSWVILYSLYGEIESYGNGARLPRFAGQLVSTNVNYSTDATGNIRQTTTLVIREWSHIFKMPIRLDARAAELSLKDQALAIANKDKAQDNAFFTDTTLQDFSKNVINAFDFVRIVLYFIGAYSRIDDLVKDNEKLAGLPQFSSIALNAPAIPKQFTEDLGLKVSDNKNPYQSDMVDYWIGVQDGVGPFLEFSGIFSSGELEAYKDLYKTKTNRPFISNILSLFAKGFSAFDVITSVGDMNLNELYTDLIYVKGDDSKILAKPTIVYRARPTILKSDEENYFALTKEKLNYPWAYYDDLPRIKIDSVYIRSLTLIDSAETSPNYIRPDIVQSRLEEPENLSNLSIKKLPSQMYRYGGVSAFVPVQFNLPTGVLKDKKEQKDLKTTEENDKQSRVQKWFSDVKNFTILSESFQYMKPDVRIVLKDNNIPLSVGMNIEFILTDITYVAHIESISIDHGIDARGVIYTDTVLNCSRLVYLRGAFLEPLAPKMFADLFVRLNQIKPESQI